MRLSDALRLTPSSAGRMLRTKLLKLAHLHAAQVLQLAEAFLRGGVYVARQQLLDDLQPHLEADEALQGAVVKIGGNPFALRFPRALRLGSDDDVVPHRVRQPALGIPACAETRARRLRRIEAVTQVHHASVPCHRRERASAIPSPR